MILLGSIILFISAILQSLTGFGFSILAVPLMTQIFSPKETIPILLILSIVLNISVIWSAKKYISIKKIWMILLGGIIGVPIGTKILVGLNPDFFKFLIGIFIFSFGLIQFRGIKFHLKKEKLWYIPIGILSGILGGSVSMSGPPLIMFLTNKGTDKHEFRGNLATYFFLLNLFIIPVYISNGLLSIHIIKLSAIFFPGLILGVSIGTYFSHKIKEQLFKKIVLLILLIIGVIAIFSGIKGIL